MKILIVGDGKVGYACAEQLSLENHDVTIIDNRAEALRKAVEKLDVLCIEGFGSSVESLQEAGIEKMDLVIAATSSDEINMICSLMASKLSEAHIIARIRRTEYANSESFLKETFGLDAIVNPEHLAANEISRLMRDSHALSIESFMKGRIELCAYMLNEGCPIVNQQLKHITPSIGINTLIGLVRHGDEAIIPNGNTVLHAGDLIYVVGEPRENVQFAKYLGITQAKLRNVMIVGGGRIAYHLVRQLLKLGMKARVIEQDVDRCEALHQALPDTLIITGDGTDIELLEQENLDDMDAFIALTNIDEENIVAALHAKDKGVPRVVAKVTRKYYERMTRGIATISPKDLAANVIVQYVRSLVNSQGSFVKRLFRIAGGQAEAMEFVAAGSSQVIGVPLKELRLKPGILVAAIEHKGDIIIPHGDDAIQQGDNVIIISNADGFFVDLNQILIGG